MSKPASHYLDIYSVWLHVARSRKEWTKIGQLVDVDLDEPDGIGRTECHEDGVRCDIAILIDVKAHSAAGDKLNCALAETIAHESSHVAGMIFQRIGQDHSANDETCAYLVGWISGWIWEHIEQA